MLIRPETPSDLEAIREINLAAFADHPFSRQTEHLIVAALREAGALAVSLVVEERDRVAGHIAFSRAPIGDRDLGWYLLGPVAVLPGMQRRGLGSALVRAGLDELRRLGAQGCVLVGDPAFYTRLGFRQAISLRYPGVPQEVVLCLPLSGPEPEGDVVHHSAFEAGL
jgi:putative acetyltransferase